MRSMSRSRRLTGRCTGRRLGSCTPAAFAAAAAADVEAPGALRAAALAAAVRLLGACGGPPRLALVPPAACRRLGAAPLARRGREERRTDGSSNACGQEILLA